MQLKKVVELGKINLLYSNPQAVEKKRNKEAKTGKPSRISAPMSVLLSNLFILVLFMALYGFMLGNMNFMEYPGFFTIYILMFSAITILQGFYTIYNLFYESKDKEYYLPLPFTSGEIFGSKLIVIFLTVIPYLAPSGVIFYMAARDASRSVLPSFLTALLLFLLLLAVVFMVAIVFVHFITKLTVFQKHQKTMTTALYTISSIGMVVIIFFISNLSTNADVNIGQVLPDYTPLPFIRVFHVAATNPFSSEALKGLALWFILLLVLSFILYKWIIPNFYRATIDQPVRSEKTNRVEEKVTNEKKKGTTRKVTKQPATVNQSLWKYNFGLIQDGTLMMQFLSSSIILPIFMLGPLLLNGLELPEIPPYFWGLFFFAGFVYTFLTLSSISIVGVIISLDRENFLYMKSLPFSMKNYLRLKFLFAFTVQSSLPVIVSIILMIVAKVPLIFGISFVLGLLIGLFTMSQFYFVRDYRFLNLDWQNLTELFGRGGGNFVQAITIFMTALVGIIAIAGFTFLLITLSSVGRVIASSIMVLVPVLIAGLFTYHYQKNFWPQFDD